MGWLWIVGGFLKRNWKIIVIALAIAAAAWAFNSWLNGVKKKAYDNGVRVEREWWEKEVKKINEQNRKHEQKLAESAIDLGKAFAEAESKRDKATNTHTTTIKEYFNDNPDGEQCRVPQKILDERNAIRHLGPNPRP